MNNEQLAALIGAGENDGLLPDLWENMSRFYKKLSEQYAVRYAENCARYGITAADLYQESYLSMLDAVKAYSGKDADAAFITFAGYCYKNRVFSLIGLRAGHRSDALNRCIMSLNEPLEDKDGDGDAERGDLVSDQSAGAPFEDIERRDQAERVRAAVCAALTDKQERQTIERHFFEGKTLQEIAEAEGVSLELVQRVKIRAYRHLRNNRALQALADIDYYQHIGAAACQRGGSIVERIAERRVLAE